MSYYVLLQQYWWFIISLLGALLVFLTFVQGGQSLLWCLGKNEEARRMLMLATGRKWELTFTTLVVFGGAFFASFPLFYSTSFGGAYWVWMLLLLCFVLQAVSYEFQLKKGNLMGTEVYRWFLFANGVLAPFLLGIAVSTFFHGAEFVIDKGNLLNPTMPVISSWAGAAHGLEAVLNPWNVCLGLAVLFLSRVLACLYFMGCMADRDILRRCRRQLAWNTLAFLLLFSAYMAHWLTMPGFAVSQTSGLVEIREWKYLTNLVEMPGVFAALAAGVVAVAAGALFPFFFRSGVAIWLAGSGTVLVVLSLLLCAGWNNTAYYPSNVDLQSSLTLANSCSSYFTLSVMAVVSVLIPFVAAYIIWAWRALDRGRITEDDVANGAH